MNHEGWLFSFAKVPRNRAWLTAFHIPSADLLHSTHCGFWLVVSGMSGSELLVFLTSPVLSGFCFLLASFLLVPIRGSNFWFQLLVPTSGSYFWFLLLDFTSGSYFWILLLQLFVDGCYFLFL